MRGEREFPNVLHSSPKSSVEETRDGSTLWVSTRCFSDQEDDPLRDLSLGDHRWSVTIEWERRGDYDGGVGTIKSYGLKRLRFLPRHVWSGTEESKEWRECDVYILTRETQSREFNKGSGK